MKKEFGGVLRTVSPRVLINDKKPDNLDNFFLVLALVFNDLKGLLLFNKIIKEEYRMPNAGELTAHSGEMGGLNIQIKKYLIANVVEFLNFLQANKNNTSSVQFQLLVKKIDKELQLSWSRLLAPDEEKGSILSKFGRIRSNVAFHFNHNTTELKRGFMKNFFEMQLPQFQKAYYSLGEEMGTTRFYYADAAVQGYIQSILESDNDTELTGFVNDMNHTIRITLEQYINNKKTQNKSL